MNLLILEIEGDTLQCRVDQTHHKYHRTLEEVVVDFHHPECHLHLNQDNWNIIIIDNKWT